MINKVDILQYFLTLSSFWKVIKTAYDKSVPN